MIRYINLWSLKFMQYCCCFFSANLGMVPVPAKLEKWPSILVKLGIFFPAIYNLQKKQQQKKNAESHPHSIAQKVKYINLMWKDGCMLLWIDFVNFSPKFNDCHMGFLTCHGKIWLRVWKKKDTFCNWKWYPLLVPLIQREKKHCHVTHNLSKTECIFVLRAELS